MASYLQLLLSYIVNNQTALNQQREHDIRLIVPTTIDACNNASSHSNNNNITTSHYNDDDGDPNGDINNNDDHSAPNVAPFQWQHQEYSISTATATTNTTTATTGHHRSMETIDAIAQAAQLMDTANNNANDIIGQYLNETVIINVTDATAAADALDSLEHNLELSGDHHNQIISHQLMEQQLSNVAITITNNCLQQQQMREYYSDYDILIGVRIATSLAILFVAFIVFVVYKTVCHEKRHNKRVQQNNLRLANHLYNIS